MSAKLPACPKCKKSDGYYINGLLSRNVKLYHSFAKGYDEEKTKEHIEDQETILKETGKKLVCVACGQSFAKIIKKNQIILL